MKKTLLRPFLLAATLFAAAVAGDAQASFCRPRALALTKSLPTLSYRCESGLDDWDEAVLKAPRRIAALEKYALALENFASAAWWDASADDLGACEIRGRTGRLTAAEKEKATNGGSQPRVIGGSRWRIVVAPDPCWQKGYGGADVFLIARVGGGKAHALLAVDGFFSRADRAVDFDVARNGAEDIAEISTTSGGLNPTQTNYYFAADPKTGRPAPWNAFLPGAAPTNAVTSAMLLEDASEYGLAEDAPDPLLVFRAGRLAPTFETYADKGATMTGSGHPKFERRTFRWDGRVFR